MCLTTGTVGNVSVKSLGIRNLVGGHRMIKFKSKAICKFLLFFFVLVKLPLVKVLAKKKTPCSHKSILVLCGAHMGDVLCMVPALHLLRHLNPNSEISIPVSPALCVFLEEVLQT